MVLAWLERDGIPTLMAQLLDTILRLVAEDRDVIGEHASERPEERGIVERQAEALVEGGRMIVERLDAAPNPAVEVRETLPDGTEFKAVWSYLRESGEAKLVTLNRNRSRPGWF